MGNLRIKEAASGRRVRQETSDVERGIGETSRGRPTDDDRGLSLPTGTTCHQRLPIRRPLPIGVSFEIRERQNGLPYLIDVTMPRVNINDAIHHIIEVLHHLVSTTTVTPRAYDLIRRNRALRQQLVDLIRATEPSGVLQIPIRLDRRPRSNRVNAVTILSRSIEFPEQQERQTRPEPEGSLPSFHPPIEDWGQRQAFWSLLRGLVLSVAGGILGSLVSSILMTGDLINFRTEYLRYAYRRGYWHAVFWAPPYPSDPNAGAFMSGRAHRHRQTVIEKYDEGYRVGSDIRQNIYDRIWQVIYGNRDQYAPQTREFVEQIHKPSFQEQREIEIARVLYDRYPWNSRAFILLFNHPVFITDR